MNGSVKDTLPNDNQLADFSYEERFKTLVKDLTLVMGAGVFLSAVGVAWLIFR